jgi:hypothetical protein
MTVFWDVLGLLDDHRPDDGGSKNLQNVGKFLPNYTAQHSRRQSPVVLCGPETWSLTLKEE